MPGFSINNVGGHRESPSATAEYYYSYTWTIEDMFGDFDQGTKDLIINAKQMSLPAFAVSKESYVAASLEYKFAKHVTFDDVKITWYDTVGMVALLKKWRRTVWTEETGVSAPAGYKKRTYQRQYIANKRVNDSSQSDDDRDVRYKLEGSWPSIIRYGDLTYTNSDIKIVEVTVTYDWAEEDAD